MALTFEKTLILADEYSERTVNHLVNEPDNTLYQYYIKNDRQYDANTKIVRANYDDLTWKYPTAGCITSQVIDRLVVKHFPMVGAIACFKYKGQEVSKVLAPIHIKNRKLTSPGLIMDASGDDMLFSFSSPKDVTYICYRLILRKGLFAIEYVTYDTSLHVPFPDHNGKYDIYCVGYTGEGESISEDSEHISWMQKNGTDDPDTPPYYTKADIDALIKNLQDQIGDIGSLLDTLNGEVV